MGKRKVVQRFFLDRLDGVEMRAYEVRDALRAWAIEQGMPGVRIRTLRTKSAPGVTVPYPAHVAVEFENANHALWFKMRWSPDIAAYARHRADIDGHNERRVRAYSQPTNFLDPIHQYASFLAAGLTPEQSAYAAASAIHETAPRRIAPYIEAAIGSPPLSVRLPQPFTPPSERPPIEVKTQEDLLFYFGGPYEKLTQNS